MNEEKKTGLKENLQIDDLDKVAGGATWALITDMQCNKCGYSGRVSGRVEECDCPNCGSKGTYKRIPRTHTYSGRL